MNRIEASIEHDVSLDQYLDRGSRICDYSLVLELCFVRIVTFLI